MGDGKRLKERLQATMPGTAAPLSAFEAIRVRRTHKRFTERPVTREEIELLLDAAVLAPNHKMTEPWRFVVLGPKAKQMLGGIRAEAKCGPPAPDEDEPTAARRADIVVKSLGIPAVVAVAMREDDDDERREEDYAATFMAIQNMLLAAVAIGLGTKVATGRVLRGDALRAVLQLRKRERCVALIHMGEPAEVRAMKARTPAGELTRWLD